MDALNFIPSQAGDHWIARQPDGESVGAIHKTSGVFPVVMFDTRGSMCAVGIRQRRFTAQHLMAKAWQLQLSKGGNP